MDFVWPSANRWPSRFPLERCLKATICSRSRSSIHQRRHERFWIRCAGSASSRLSVLADAVRAKSPCVYSDCASRSDDGVPGAGAWASQKRPGTVTRATDAAIASWDFDWDLSGWRCRSVICLSARSARSYRKCQRPTNKSPLRSGRRVPGADVVASSRPVRRSLVGTRVSVGPR